MSVLSKALRVVKKSSRKIGRVVPKSLIKKAIRATPMLGTAYAAYDIAKAGFSMLGGGGARPPALPSPPTFGARVPMRAMPGALPATSPSYGPGLMWWRGPGGKMQLPWSDPKVHESLRGFSLDDSMLRTYYRAPKGYVVVKDDQGRPYPLRQDVAKMIGWWRPGAKPPMSASEWGALKSANRVVNKLKKMNRMAKKVANYDPSRTRKIYVGKSTSRKGR